MKKSRLFMMLFALLPFGVQGQNTQEESTDSDNEKYKYVVTNKFGDNWFISAGAGASVMLGEDDNEGKFGKRISPALQIGIGKWFTPGLGLRLQYNGLNARGFGNKSAGYITGSPDADGYYKEKIKYANLHGDVMFNLTNMFCGYKESRLYNAIPYVGAGMIFIPSKNQHGNRQLYAGINLGYINRFRITDAWDINLEASALMMRDDFDGQGGNIKMDAVLSLTAGVTYRFKARGFKEAIVKNTGISPAEMDAIRNQLNESLAKNKELEAALIAEKNKPVVKEEPKEVYVSSPRTVFFSINEAKVSPKEKVNIRYIAEQMKQSPNKKWTITGYADNATGTPEFNAKLTQKRAENVYNMLVNDFGVNPNQLTVISKGGVDNMYESAALNRVVIVE